MQTNCQTEVQQSQIRRYKEIKIKKREGEEIGKGREKIG